MWGDWKDWKCCNLMCVLLCGESEKNYTTDYAEHCTFGPGYHKNAFLFKGNNSAKNQSTKKSLKLINRSYTISFQLH